MAFFFRTVKKYPELIPLFVPVVTILSGATYVGLRTFHNSADIQLTSELPRYEQKSFKREGRILKAPVDLSTEKPHIGWFGVSSHEKVFQDKEK